MPVRAPLPPTPVPFRVSASAPMATLLMFSVAPLDTTTPPAVVPRAVALDATTVPADIVVRPCVGVRPGQSERAAVLLHEGTASGNHWSRSPA